MSNKSLQPLYGMNLEELQNLCSELAMPRFAAKQIAGWLYRRGATDIEQMSDLSKANRARLAQHYTVGLSAPVKVSTSTDGTKKYLFRLSGDNVMGDVFIESVYIPDNDRATLCVSTQAGCKMGCKFCMTGTLGFHGQLPVVEILNQIFSIPDSDKLTNIVYMGEGEPMDNIDHVLRSLQVMTESWGCAWSPKRITVSTVGVVPGLERFLKESECHLAVSLHNPFGAERQDIMPIEKRYHLTDVVAMLKQYDWQHQRRVSFEYICWHGQNDTIRHAKELVRLLKGLPCRINLIRFHAGVDQAFAGSDEKQMEWLRDYLSDNGITTTIRRSRGEDILAACGMLVNALSQQ
jgi:23S rRNA (adenine2503-C2)-methyltransferase